MSLVQLNCSSVNQVNTNPYLEKISALENKVKDLNDSIKYASVIQEAILPNIHLFLEVFNDAFVYYQPKDLLSGDFYWIYRHKQSVYFAVGDCTGHGVPGALINMAANSFLQQIIKQKGVYNPAQIVTLLDKEISLLLNNNRSVGKTYDGIDLAFCRFDLQTRKGHFCSAGRPLYLYRKDKLHEFKKGKFAIGFDSKNEKKFESIYFNLRKGDTFYLFSDGYTDQFGGQNVKKFNRKRFKNLLQSIQFMDLKKQEEALRLNFDNWKNSHEQIDDVCVLGVRI